jgi:hypothetical protein
MSLNGAAGFSQRDAVHPTAASRAPGGGGGSAWAGWVVFGGVLLLFGGLLHIGQGIVALVDDDFYAVGSDGLVVDVDYTAWGVFHLVLGALACLIGIGLFTGNVVARGAAVVLAGVSALTNLVWLPAYPFWGLISIAFDLVVLYAVLVHGDELAEPSWPTPAAPSAQPGSVPAREEVS